ncbi:hypothetical protein SprV_0401721100 [Sparganum proliferum]
MSSELPACQCRSRGGQHGYLEVTTSRVDPFTTVAATATTANSIVTEVMSESGDQDERPHDAVLFANKGGIVKETDRALKSSFYLPRRPDSYRSPPFETIKFSIR